MEPIQTLLMDFGPEHLLVQQLAEILANSIEPAFAIQSGCGSIRDLTSATKSLLACMGVYAPVLFFFTFEHPPEDVLIASLVETAQECGTCKASIVVTKAQSPGQVTHLLDLGATDVWLSPVRPTEALGRIAHWLGLVAARERTLALE